MINAVRMIDTIGQNVDRLVAFPYWQDRLIGSYTTRSFAATDAQFASIKHPIKIDQEATSVLARGARVKDVEPGAASIANAVAIARKGIEFVTYLPLLEDPTSLAECRAAMSKAGVKGMRYWVADWTANENKALAFLAANADVVAVQWASSESAAAGRNLVVPGTNGLTLGDLNVDLSVGRTAFWLPAPKPVAKPAKGIWKALLELDVEHDLAKITSQPGENVEMGSEDLMAHRLVDVNLHNGVWDVHRLKGER
jgi:hypothetical protein